MLRLYPIDVRYRILRLHDSARLHAVSDCDHGGGGRLVADADESRDGDEERRRAGVGGAGDRVAKDRLTRATPRNARACCD